jgi:hypothetical protein
MTWKRPTSHVAKKFRIQPPAGKITLTLFWDTEGAIVVHFTGKVKRLTFRFPYVWPNEISSKKNKIFTRRRSHWRGEKLVKDATKKKNVFSLKELKNM